MKKKILAVLLAVCLLAGVLPMGASAEGTGGYAELTLNTPLTGNFNPPNGGVGVTEMADVPVGSFTAPEAGIYLFTCHNNASNLESLGNSYMSRLSSFNFCDPAENFGERTTPAATVTSVTGCVDKFEALVLDENETVYFSQDVGLQDNHFFSELDDLSFTATITKAADDHIITAALDTPIQQPAGTSEFDPNSYYFYKFTAPEDGCYSASCSDEDCYAVSTYHEWNESGERSYCTSYGFHKAGMTWYTALLTPNGGTFAIKKRTPFVTLEVNTEYKMADMTLVDEIHETVTGADFIPEKSGKFTFTANPMGSYQGIEIQEEAGYPTVGFVRNESDQAKALSLSVNLEVGKRYRVIVSSFMDPLRHDLTLKVASASSTPSTPSTPSGGGSSVEPVEPEFDTNPDGSQTETQTAEDGTVTAITTWDDGKQAVSVKSPEGGASISVTAATGEKVAEVNLPAQPAEAKKFDDVKDGWYRSAVDKATGYGLFNGTTETTFGPNDPMTRGMLATVLHNLSGKPAYGTDENVFADVTANAWYQDPVDWAYKAGVVSGTSATEFSPDDNITREQLVTMLYNYAGKIGAGSGGRAVLTGFPDAGKVSGYAQTPMQWAVAEGFISGRAEGGKNYIAPKGTASRAEVAAVLTKFVEYLKK